MEPLAILHIIETFPNSRSTFEYIGTEMVFSSNLDKMSKMIFKWDTDSYKSEGFILNPICILYSIVCPYMSLYVFLCTKYTNKICLNQIMYTRILLRSSFASGSDATFIELGNRCNDTS